MTDVTDPRPALLERLRAAYGAWERRLETLTEAALHAPRSPSGWSVADVLAHLEGWQRVTLARLEAADAGTVPVFPSWRGSRSPSTAAELDAANAALDREQRGRPWTAVVADWRSGAAEVVRLSATLPLDVLTDVGRHHQLPRHALVDVITATAAHHEHHAVAVERWLDGDGSGRSGSAGA